MTEVKDVTTTEAVQSVDKLIAEREVVAAREAELVDNLTTALMKLGYRVTPVRRSRKRPGRAPSSGGRAPPHLVPGARQGKAETAGPLQHAAHLRHPCPGLGGGPGLGREDARSHDADDAHDPVLPVCPEPDTAGREAPGSEPRKDERRNEIE